ncbi:MAG: type II toxin-antitoxin system VapC family toxin [Candidatus Sigynarchaeota archaeon]
MDKKVLDINCFSIYFVNNHPGYKFVKSLVDAGLRREFNLVIPEILPFRAYWVLTTKWQIPKIDAKNVISEFIRSYSSPIYAGLSREGEIKAFEYASTFNHDIYDCYYIALALQEGATAILTTDTGFKKLCDRVGLAYENPVPEEILKTFVTFQ